MASTLSPSSSHRFSTRLPSESHTLFRHFPPIKVTFPPHFSLSRSRFFDTFLLSSSKGVAPFTTSQRGVGVLITMHGRSRITTDPRIPTMPGRERRGGKNKSLKTINRKTKHNPVPQYERSDYPKHPRGDERGGETAVGEYG